MYYFIVIQFPTHSSVPDDLEPGQLHRYKKKAEIDLAVKKLGKFLLGGITLKLYRPETDFTFREIEQNGTRVLQVVDRETEDWVAAARILEYS